MPTSAEYTEDADILAEDSDCSLEDDLRSRTAIETSIQQAADDKQTTLRNLRKELALSVPGI